MVDCNDALSCWFRVFSMSNKANSGAGALPPHVQLEMMRQAADGGGANAEYNFGNALIAASMYTAGIDNLKKAAEHDHAAAQYDLARVYHTGLGGTKTDAKQARYYLEKSAALNHPPAMTMLGVWNLRAINTGGVPTSPDDIKSAFELFKRAADLGDVSALFALGSELVSGSVIPADPKAGALYLVRGAAKGDSDCMMMLADCYHNGNGVKQDYSRAFKLYESAAKNGQSNALGRLGEYLFFGQGVTQDLKAAVKHFETAALQHGDVHAYYRLGTCYMDGIGVKKNVRLGQSYMNKAISQGSTSAMAELGRRYLVGNGVTRDVNRGIEYFVQGAKAGDVDCKAFLATTHVARKDPDSISLAISLYKECADAGSLDATAILGRYYLNGIGVDQDVELGVSMVTRAADGGNALANDVMGDCYSEGVGVDINDSKAFEYYQKSSALGRPSACHSLACMYRDGRGVERDLYKAIELFENAINGGQQRSRLALGMIYLSGDSIEKDLEQARSLFSTHKPSTNVKRLTNDNDGCCMNCGQSFGEKLAGIVPIVLSCDHKMCDVCAVDMFVKHVLHVINDAAAGQCRCPCCNSVLSEHDIERAFSKYAKYD